jgi:diguanylate cyclase (GGDEF)-like protein
VRVLACLTDAHNPWLVILAACVCIGGGWVAFALYARASSRVGIQRNGWLFLGAVAAGTSVWCTHFVAMLAFDVGLPVTFDPVLTMVSLIMVIGGTAAAFGLAGGGMRMRIGAGILLGLSISAMHYTGMMAYRVDGLVAWTSSYILASIGGAVAFGTFSLLAADRSKPLVAVAFFVGAVVTLHFTGMAAVSVTPLSDSAALPSGAAAVAMAVAVTGGALLIVGTGIASYMIDEDTTERNLDVLRHMALNDALTGIPNRASFGNYLGLELARAEKDGRNLAVICIDLDKFKEINDIRGHDAGDQALKIIAERLSSTLRDGEFVARIGGDEFAALKRFEGHGELVEFVDRLESVLFESMNIDDFDVVPGASIGVSVYPHDGDSPARLVGNADLAMYRAKADVSRAVCYYEAEMDERARERRDLALDLRRAIELNQLELHYQVQTSVQDRTVVGYEVLLRWTHPTRGSVPPAEFIPLAEETGIILTIGEWVLRTACRQAANWNSDAKIAINLSAVQLGHCDMAKLVHEVLLETGLPATRLELEITESSIIQDKVRSLHVLRQIRALGVTIAIDDFGTGYSSLETLRSFPFDRIKLDRSFMKEVEHNSQARAIIRAVLALGKSLEISVLAEGVETEEQLRLLQSQGCDEVQGYYLGRPEPQIASGTPLSLSA